MRSFLNRCQSRVAKVGGYVLVRCAVPARRRRPGLPSASALRANGAGGITATEQLASRVEGVVLGGGCRWARSPPAGCGAT